MSPRKEETPFYTSLSCSQSLPSSTDMVLVIQYTSRSFIFLVLHQLLRFSTVSCSDVGPGEGTTVLGVGTQSPKIVSGEENSRDTEGPEMKEDRQHRQCSR